MTRPGTVLLVILGSKCFAQRENGMHLQSVSHQTLHEIFCQSSQSLYSVKWNLGHVSSVWVIDRFKMDWADSRAFPVCAVMWFGISRADHSHSVDVPDFIFVLILHAFPNGLLRATIGKHLWWFLILNSAETKWMWLSLWKNRYCYSGITTFSVSEVFFSTWSVQMFFYCPVLILLHQLLNERNDDLFLPMATDDLISKSGPHGVQFKWLPTSSHWATVALTNISKPGLRLRHAGGFYRRCYIHGTNYWVHLFGRRSNFVQMYAWGDSTILSFWSKSNARSESQFILGKYVMSISNSVQYNRRTFHGPWWTTIANDRTGSTYETTTSQIRFATESDCRIFWHVLPV